MPALRVSVVIITRNQRAFLERSLPLLSAQEGMLPPEIIVVDSGSTDGALDMVRSSGARLVCLSPSDFSYARAHNAGARAATGDILVRLSGDAVPARTNWLHRLTAPFQDDSVAAAWGRQILPPGVRNAVEQRFEAVLRSPRSGRPRCYQHVVTPLGSSMAVRQALWEAQPYDERLPQAEDYAFLRHWTRQGYRGVFVPDAVIIHGHEESLGSALRRSLYQSFVQGLILSGWYDNPSPQTAAAVAAAVAAAAPAVDAPPVEC